MVVIQRASARLSETDCLEEDILKREDEDGDNQQKGVKDVGGREKKQVLG